MDQYSGILINSPFGKFDSKNYEFQARKADGIFKHTLTPIVTTSSVLGIVFNGGAAIAADTAAYYGSMARFQNLTRVKRVNKNMILGATGDFSDFQYLTDVIDQKIISEEILNDNFSMKPHSLYSWLTRMLYNRRNKFNPLWNNIVVAGFENGTGFLGGVDKLGMSYKDKCMGTGLGAHIALPLLRNALEENPDLSKQEAVSVLVKGMEVLFYRDARTISQFQIGIVTADGTEISEVMKVDEKWEYSLNQSSYE